MKTPQADGCDDAIPPRAALSVVLDTNAVLDWLVFENPVCADWHARMRNGRVRWLATGAMRDELSIVLDRESIRSHRPDLLALWTVWSQFAVTTEAIDVSSDIGRRLYCTDRSDQKFIDLAVTQRAQWLITRDRALLKLRSRARAFGVEIATPDDWPFESEHT